MSRDSAATPGNRRDSDDVSVQLLKAETHRTWIEQVFQKRECTKFIATQKDKHRSVVKCGCGRVQSKHYFLSPSPSMLTSSEEKWVPSHHTQPYATDAFGTIEFQGGPHPTKAQFVRLSHDTEPSLILQLLQNQWGLELPKLLISVHGGIANFDLQPKLKRVFRKGLLKAAKTTGAWIVSGGINTGVMRHVGEALGDTLVQSRNNIVTLGIAPWGVVHNRNDLIGRDTVTPYHAIANPKSNTVVLNSNHSYFLLVDNGTIGKYGSEIILRKKLEKYISQQKISTRSGIKNYSTPVVCLILEGGTNTIRTVLECITDSPPVPVVVCDGSGRAADLIAFTHKYAQDDGTMPETLRDQLILTIEKTFKYNREHAEKVFIELMLCVKKKELITVFRMGEEKQDIDLAILTALLKAQNASAPDQLSLALTWNRVDIARSHIFVYGQEWPEGALDQAMMDALVNDRVDFVKLLLENGVSMQKWLTIARLEELYNIKQEPSSTLRYLVRENKKHLPMNYRYTLYDIGQVIEKLMGGAFRASFCRKKFRTMYNAVMKKGHQISNIVLEVPLPLDPVPIQEVFKYPFHELMVWAVLLRRHRMAQFMWEHGEEALAKALIACKLYKSMAHEAAQDDLEIDISEELRNHAKEFANLALELLEQCYRTDEDVTQQLLTYELHNWSDQTVLSLAVSASHRDFLANTCCQILLTEMWMGGLRMRKYTSLKVILGILFFPSIAFLEYKTKEELQLMPQTMEEHEQEMADSDTDSDSSDDYARDNLGTAAANPSTSPQAAGATTSDPVAPGISAMASSAAESLSMEDLKDPVGFPALNGGPIVSEINITFQKKSSPLRIGKKFYEFYTAPITKFWSHTIGYILFLLLMTYVVLVRLPPLPAWTEAVCIAYVFSLSLEQLREIFSSEPKKMSQKFLVYFGDFWNTVNTIAVVIFYIGVVLRFTPGLLLHGKVFYVVDIVFWYIRILDMVGVNKYLGPYVMMIGKMMYDMMYFIIILVIVLMSFGVVRQSITYPNEEFSWTLVKDIYLKPYFMIYGEVYAGEIDPECRDEPGYEWQCVPGRWVVPAAMTVYLIVANILLINLLIAVFNATFHKINTVSTQVWKFQRYSLVIEYESKPILPPPLIIVCHLYLFIKFLIRRCKKKREYFDNGLKLFLDEEDVERLHDFEEECMEDLFRLREHTRLNTADEKIRQTNERVENMSMRLDDMHQKENTMRLSLQTVDYRLAKIEEVTMQNAQTLENLSQLLVSSAVLNPTTAVQHRLQQSKSYGSSYSGGESSEGSDEQETKPFSRAAPHRVLKSKKTSKMEEILRPFTDYSKKHRYRPPFCRSRTVASAVPLSGGEFRDYSSHANQKEPAASTSKSSFSPKLGSDLYRKRRSKAIGRLREQFAECAPLDEQVENSPENTKGVRFSDESCESARPRRLWRDGDGDSRSSSTSSSTPQQACGEDRDPTVTSGRGPRTPMRVTQSLPEELSPVHPTPQPAKTPSREQQQHLPSSVAPITPIITPNRSDYTSITDDIDCSWISSNSPGGSPVTPRRAFSGFEVDVDLYTKKSSTPEKTTSRGREEADQLKIAEESEHQQMELMIRRRMRQISLTESDSISDIAKLLIQQEENGGGSSSDTEPGIQSDDEFCLSGRHIPKFGTLKHVNSEPSLKQKSLDGLEMQVMQGANRRQHSLDVPGDNGDDFDIEETRRERAARARARKSASEEPQESDVTVQIGRHGSMEVVKVKKAQKVSFKRKGRSNSKV